MLHSKCRCVSHKHLLFYVIMVLKARTGGARGRERP